MFITLLIQYYKNGWIIRCKSEISKSTCIDHCILEEMRVSDFNKKVTEIYGTKHLTIPSSVTSAEGLFLCGIKDKVNQRDEQGETSSNDPQWCPVNRQSYNSGKKSSARIRGVHLSLEDFLHEIETYLMESVFNNWSFFFFNNFSAGGKQIQFYSKHERPYFHLKFKF